MARLPTSSRRPLRLCALAVLASRGLGYTRRSSGASEEEAADRELDDARSVKDCFCGGSRNINLWRRFHNELHAGLAADPGFQGDWVHSLCGMAYPVIFRIIQVEPDDDTFTMHTDCPAGFMTMAAVCAQSSALRHAEGSETEVAGGDLEGGEAGDDAVENQAKTTAVDMVADGGDGIVVSESTGLPWRQTERVVHEEGASVGDFFGPVRLADCFIHCERNSLCRSFAHGPHGCHLKARCVSRGEPMVAAGVQGDDYRTYYREPCTRGSGGGVSVGKALSTWAAKPWGPATSSAEAQHLEEMQNMMTFALRSLEFCFHCLDESPWPFLVGEILENYALAVEAPGDFSWKRAAGRLLGPSTRPGVGPESETPTLDPPADYAAIGTLPRARLTLLRLQVRWTRGLESEAGFWRKKLSLDPGENDNLPRLYEWLETGKVTWWLDDPCTWLADARTRATSISRSAARQTPRILNAGSGPFAPGRLECQLDIALLPPRAATAVGGASASAVRWQVPVVSADGLARFYLRLMDEQGHAAPQVPVQCPVEELHGCFPPAYFDVVHMRNALDHVFDPLLGIERMLHATRPGGWVLLRHARNEGVPGKFRNGLHQWAFDARAAEGDAGRWSFLMWNPELEVDVTEYLLREGLAAEVRTALREHPSADAPPDERYVWVEIRKPTEREVAARRAALANEAFAALGDPGASIRSTAA